MFCIALERFRPHCEPVFSRGFRLVKALWSGAARISGPLPEPQSAVPGQSDGTPALSAHWPPIGRSIFGSIYNEHGFLSFLIFLPGPRKRMCFFPSYNPMGWWRFIVSLMGCLMLFDQLEHLLSQLKS